jgi:hypothetical protein
MIQADDKFRRSAEEAVWRPGEWSYSDELNDLRSTMKEIASRSQQLKVQKHLRLCRLEAVCT